MATAARTNCLTSLAIILLVAGSLVVRTSSLPASAQCHSRIRRLMSRCSKNIIDPRCCDAVKVVGVECLCTLFNHGITNDIKIIEPLFAARFCGMTFQPGSKCGAITIPNP